MPKEGLLTANEVAGYLKCSVSTVRRLVVRAQIPHFRVSTLVRFRRSDIDAWLLKHREGELATDSLKLPEDHPDQLPLFGRELARDWDL